MRTIFFDAGLPASIWSSGTRVGDGHILLPRSHGSAVFHGKGKLRLQVALRPPISSR